MIDFIVKGMLQYGACFSCKPSLPSGEADQVCVSHRGGPQRPDCAALSVLREEGPRTQLHALQALLLHFLCSRVRPGLYTKQRGLQSGWLWLWWGLQQQHRCEAQKQEVWRPSLHPSASLRFNVRLTKRLRALSAGSRTERPRPALNRAESVPGKPLLLRLVGNL